MSNSHGSRHPDFENKLTMAWRKLIRQISSQLQLQQPVVSTVVFQRISWNLAGVKSVTIRDIYIL